MTEKKFETILADITKYIATHGQTEETEVLAKYAQCLCYQKLTDTSERLVKIMTTDDKAELDAIAQKKDSGIDFETEIQKLKEGNPERASKIAKIIDALNLDERREEIEEANLENYIAPTVGKIDSLLKMKGAAEERLESLIDGIQQADSGLNVINNSPVIKSLITQKYGDISLGTNEETGEQAIFTLLDGYITPYEQEIIECISKFKLDGQQTEGGKTWLTLGQLYRAMRHGAGTIAPKKKQKEELLKALISLSDDSRKLNFKLNNYLKVWGGFETNGGRLRIIGFDELYGKIRGQEETLIVLDNTPIICAVAENLHMYERVEQKVKSVQTHKYTLSLKTPIMINGKPVKKRSFNLNADRVKFCKKYGITRDQIEEYGDESKPWALSDSRISLRNFIYTFAFSYIRARAAGSLHENKLNYNVIFERCGVASHHETIKRAKKDISIILDHLINTVPELKAWGVYKNKGEKNYSGVGVFLQQPKADNFEEWRIMNRKTEKIGG